VRTVAVANRCARSGDVDDDVPVVAVEQIEVDVGAGDDLVGVAEEHDRRPSTTDRRGRRDRDAGPCRSSHDHECRGGNADA
jgi:hypothetical protein